MERKRPPKSIRKHIRFQKARIRREVLSLEEQEKQIEQLYQKFLKQDENKSDKRLKN